jgi:hypothetical protein
VDQWSVSHQRITVLEQGEHVEAKNGYAGAIDKIK